MNKTILHAAFKNTLPVLMGYVAMGFAAGVLLADTLRSPWSPLWAVLTSVTSISGALQFILTGWIRLATPLPEVALLTVCLNLRYAMYGLSFIEKFRGLPWKQKFYLIWAMTDETYALEVECRAPQGANPISYCLAVAMLDHAYWVIGVTAGALVGGILPFDNRGIDFAMTALFLVILTDQCRERANRWPALIGAAAAVASRLIFPVDRMLIPAMLFMLAVFLAARKRLDPERNAKSGEARS
ncbi:MAG: AzlC family ABC transporter permease [Victivallaceae bacterium]|nr:AzlC family ABC transporter permease [Victivallaceae bacterium]